MAYNITALKSDLSAVLHNTTTNTIVNINGLINRAGRQLLQDLDPQETKRIAQITGTVFNGVWDYAVPTDLKGNRVIDIFPQANRTPADVWLQGYNQNFDTRKGSAWSGDMFTILFNTSVKTIRINAPFLPAPVLMDACNSTTTFTTSGGATTPVVDNVNYTYAGGSLKFNLSAGQSTGSLIDNLVSPIDLTSALNQSTLFLDTYLPSATAVTNVNLQWGSSSTDYYSVDATTNAQGNAFVTGWNTLAFPWLGATVVGTPDVTAIDYIKVTWTYDSTLQTAVRINNINSNLGSILNMEYYSKYLFRDSTGVYKETVTDDSDLINLDTESFNLLFNLVAYYAAQQTQGVDALYFDANFFKQKYDEGLARYKLMYRSEIQKPGTLWYKIKRGGYNNLIKRWNF